MIILTGGAGMIGSMIAWHLNTILNKDQFVIVDEFLVPEQEKNIDKRDFIDLIGKVRMNYQIILKVIAKLRLSFIWVQ